MSRTVRRAALLGLVILPAFAAASVAEPTGDASGRFTMSPVDGGFLRLDKQTGAVAMCAKSGGDWSCKPVADPAVVAAAPISQLEMENRALKERIKKLEDLVEKPAAGAPPVDGPEIGPPGASQLPSEEEVDQALDYISRVYKKIRDHVRDLDKPLPPPGAHDAPPPPAGSPDMPPPTKGSL